MSKEELKKQQQQAEIMRKLIPTLYGEPMEDMRIEDAPAEKDMMYLGNIGQPGMTRSEASDRRWEARDKEYDQILELSDIPPEKRTQRQSIELAILEGDRSRRLTEEVVRTKQDHKALKEKNARWRKQKKMDEDFRRGDR
jgi:hypothetical protein